MIRSFAFTLLAVTPCLVSAAPAPAPASGANQGLGGPVLSGVCLLSREAVFANAKVGVAATQRLRQITLDTQTELTTERGPLDAEVTALRTQAASLKPDQIKAKEAALEPRINAFKATTELRARELEATRAKAMELISDQAQPVIGAVYKEKGCGLLLDRNTVLGGNFTNDLTAAVVAALDAKISTISFNRETPPATPVASSK